MPVPNNPDVVRVAMMMQRDTRQLINTFHVARAATWSAGDMVTLANAMVTWWNAYYKPSAVTGVSLVGVQVRLYDPANPLAFDLSVSPPSAGTHGGALLPGNVTSTVSLRSGLAGRANRGRFYHSGPDNASVSTIDTLSSAFITLLATLAVQLAASVFSSVGADLVVFHRNTNLYTKLVGFVIENILDSQRRRLPGRGR